MTKADLVDQVAGGVGSPSRCGAARPCNPRNREAVEVPPRDMNIFKPSTHLRSSRVEQSRASRPLPNSGLAALVLPSLLLLPACIDSVAVEDGPGVVRCEYGRAKGFPCRGLDLVAFLPLKDMGVDVSGRGVAHLDLTGVVNDLWGWTDPATDIEWALVGHATGTSFINLGDPENPVYTGILPMTEESQASIWRDIKVYRNHAFIVADAAWRHGMQVFDLTQLRGVKNPPATFTETARYDQVQSAHNIAINEESGFAYIVGSNGGEGSCLAGLHMVDIRDPASPAYAGCFTDTRTGFLTPGYVHDAQCVMYRGPDTQHRGNEICFGANETHLSIADVTAKDRPVAIAAATYPFAAYTHQGWLDEDQEYFYLNDESDEIAGVRRTRRTRTVVWDVRDLDDPIVVNQYRAQTASTDHNLYVRGDFMYQSNYTSGLRVLDISNRSHPKEVLYFDTEPSLSTTDYLGSWSNYPYFESGIIAVTSMEQGVFFLRQSLK